MGFIRKLFGFGRIIETKCISCNKVTRMIITRTRVGFETWYCADCGYEETYQELPGTD